MSSAPSSDRPATGRGSACATSSPQAAASRKAAISGPYESERRTRAVLVLCAGCAAKASSNGLRGHHRYRLTPLGRQVVGLFGKAYGRVVTPGLTLLDPRSPTTSANEARSAPHGGTSTTPSTDTSATGCRPPELKVV
jgi:hypothetical protein